MISSLFAMLSVRATAGEPSEAERSLIIRMYDQAAVQLTAILAAESTVDSIFHAAGLTPIWRNCRTSHGPGTAWLDACDDTLAPTEVIVRLAIHPVVRGSELGFAYIDRSADRSVLATVFVNRVTAVAAATAIPSDVLIGRAVAHEVGHLVLDSTNHARSGLMRGKWETGSAGLKGTWLFSHGEAARMQQAIAAWAHDRPLPLIAATRQAQ